jgi:hypothetical protein
MPVKKASKTKKPLKILLYGASGVGKTHFALHATPGQTLVFDMEGGTDLFEGRVDFDYWTDEEGYKTQSYRELRKCINFLQTKEGREYKTFVIDPVTLIWTLLQQERQDYKEDKVKNPKANETDLETFTTRDWNIVKKMHKGVIDEISALPQNVILIAREKPVVVMKNGEPIQTGEITFEGEKNTIYAVDFALHLYQEKKKRYIRVAKDRSGHYETGSVIDDPSFALFNSIVNDMEGGEESKAVKTNTEINFDQPGPEKAPTVEMINQKALAGLHAIGKEKGMTHEDISHLANTTYGVNSLNELTMKQARELYGTIKNQPEGEKMEGAVNE